MQDTTVPYRIRDLKAARDRLADARYEGASEFQDANGERVSYKSDREMAVALAALDAEIARLSGAPGTPSTYVFRTSKGL